MLIRLIVLSVSSICLYGCGQSDAPGTSQPKSETASRTGALNSQAQEPTSGQPTPAREVKNHSTGTPKTKGDVSKAVITPKPQDGTENRGTTGTAKPQNGAENSGAAATEIANDVSHSTGKGSTPKSSDLYGRWSIHPSGLKQSPFFQKMTKDKQELLLAQMEQMKMDIVITAETITVQGARGETKFTDSTPYTITQQTGASFTVKTDKKGRKKNQTFILKGEFLEVFEGGPKMVFKRVK